MNTLFRKPRGETRRARRWVAAALVAASLMYGGCLRVGADLRAVRDATQGAVTAGGRWQQQIELSVGGMSFALARVIGSFAGCEPEARAVLGAAKSVEVGVYEYHGRGDAVSPSKLIQSATDAMEARGWVRAVAVIDGHDTVAVFTEKDQDADDPVRLCVMVFDGKELVVASMRADLQPLVELALAEGHKHWHEDV